MVQEVPVGGYPSMFGFHPTTPAAGLHAPINAKPCFTGVILRERWRAFRLRQHRKDLSVLFGDGFKLLRSRSLPSVPQPPRYVLDYGHVGLLGLRFENWRKAWVSRPPPCQRILFSRQVQPAYICLPSTKWLAEPKPIRRRLAAKVGLAPTPNGLTDRRATLTLPGNG